MSRGCILRLITATDAGTYHVRYYVKGDIELEGTRA